MKKLLRSIVLCLGIILLWNAFSIQTRAAEQTDILHIHAGDTTHGGACYGNVTYGTKSAVINTGNDNSSGTNPDGTTWTQTIHHWKCTKCGRVFTSTTRVDNGVVSSIGNGNCCTVPYVIGASLSCAKTTSTVEGILHIDESTTDYAQSVTLSAYVSDILDITIDGYSWNTGETTSDIIVTSNGTYTVTLTYTDTGVQHTKSLSIDINNIDAIPPVLGTTYDDTGEMVGFVDVEITITDALSGLPLEALSLGNQTDWVESNVFRITENNTYTIYGRDIAGNIGSIDVTVTRVDESPPVFTTNYSKGGACKSVSFDILAVDDESGLPAEAYSFGNQENWTNQTHYSFSSNGTYTFYARNNSGLVSTLSVTINEIDTSGPILSVFYDNSTFTKGVTVTILAEDYGYGVSSEGFRVKGQETWSSNNSFYFTANGTYTIEGRDFGDNVSEISFPIGVIDSAGPNVTLTYDNSEYVQEGTLYASATDSQSGVSNIIFNDITHWGSSISYPITENGIYTVYSNDVLSNGGSGTIEVTNIDRELPVLTTDFENGDYIPYADLKIYITDSISGVPADALSFGSDINWSENKVFRVTENGTYYIYGRDNAGNLGFIKIPVNTIDNTPPIIEFEVYEFGDHTELVFHAYDEESGLPLEAYSTDGKETWVESNEIDNIIKNGEYTIYAIDNCGNIGEATILLNNVEHAIIIHEEELARLATFTTTSTASTTTVGAFFFLFSWLFSSGAIYARDEKGRWKKIGKAKISKRKGKHEIRMDRGLEVKISRNQIKNIKVVCSPLFRRNMKNKDVTLIYKKQSYRIYPGKETELYLKD